MVHHLLDDCRRSRNLLLSTAILAFFLPGAKSAWAADPGPRPALKALPLTEPIVVDGKLDDPAWAQAEAGGGFIQREPREGEPATEPTEVRVAYTSSMLYIGIHAFDSDPSGLVAQEMRRDQSLSGDDHLVILLDTFHDRRNAYAFEINPSGAQRDSIITDEGRDINLSWDCIWWGEARRAEDGWVAEIAIPFDSLQFSASLETWGFNVRRMIRRKNEETYWAPIFLDGNVRRISQAGTLAGLHPPRPGIDLQVKPFGTGSSTSGPRGSGSEETGETGLDVKWGITRQLTLNGTYNTDFAETEVDALRVNLTRFSLFFPEKREFFLENAGLFDYGPGSTPFGPPLVRVFHSRRIGIGPGGQRVPIEWGTRLTGRVDDWSVGLLQVATEETRLESVPGAVPQNDWSVARLKRNLGQRSSLGMIFTNRDGDDGWNRVYGLDTNLNPSRNLNLNAFYAVSDSPGTSGQNATGGFSTSWTGSRLLASFEAQEVQERFDPQVGFLLRRGVRRYSPDLHFMPRPEIKGVRHLDFQVLGQIITDRRDQVESVSASATLLGARFQTDDYISLFYDWNLERLDELFEIVPGIGIPADEYRFDALGTYFSSSAGRRASLDGFLRYGNFYNGRQYDHELTMRIRPNRFFSSESTWTRNDIRLPDGDFTVDIVRQRLSLSLSPRLSTDSYIQYNAFSDLMSLNFRFNWIYRPGADLFLVYNYNWNAPSFGALDTRDRQIVLKLTYPVEL